MLKTSSPQVMLIGCHGEESIMQLSSAKQTSLWAMQEPHCCQNERTINARLCHRYLCFACSECGVLQGVFNAEKTFPASVAACIGTRCASTHRELWCGFLFHFQQNWVCQLCLPGGGSISSFDSLKVIRQPEFQPRFTTLYWILLAQRGQDTDGQRDPHPTEQPPPFQSNHICKKYRTKQGKSTDFSIVLCMYGWSIAQSFGSFPFRKALALQDIQRTTGTMVVRRKKLHYSWAT